MATSYVIAVDLGGTNLRVGAVGESGSIEEKDKQEAQARQGSEAVLNRMLASIQAMIQKVEARQGRVVGVSLGIPGIVDSQKGIVYQSPHFPDWKNLEVLSFFQKHISYPIKMDNDANFAALGEGWKGAAQGLKSYVMLTFGTGIGGGIVIDGKVLHGDRGFAGELGHICIEASGPRCACGSRGCWEMYTSSWGIRRHVEISDDVRGRENLLSRFGGIVERMQISELYEAALDGDMFANSIFKRMGYYLGVGLGTLVNTLGVETFVIGGGISEAWNFFIEPAKKELSERTYKETARQVQLKKAALGDDAGLVGGGASFFK